MNELLELIKNGLGQHLNGNCWNMLYEHGLIVLKEPKETPNPFGDKIFKQTHILITENFAFSELNPHNFELTNDIVDNLVELCKNLEVIREEVQRPLTIVSGYRDKAYNKIVGGVEDSQHILGKAGDIKTTDPQGFADMLRKLMKDGKIAKGGIGVYKSQGFVHYDTRGEYVTWNG